MAVSQEAHAGCLSFELSARQNRIVVNCGLPATSRDSWRQVARATAAHSTVTFNDTSSCRFIEFGTDQAHALRHADGRRPARRRGRARGAGERPRAARVARRLRRHLQRHPPARRCMLSTDGRRLDGEDVFTPAKGETVPAGRDQFAVRFHLHPSVKANRLADGHSAMLLMPNKEVLDLQRLRGPGRHRGKRLSRRPGRTAPHRADRHLRPRPQGDAGAVDLRRPCRAGPAARAGRARKSRSCRCDARSPRRCKRALTIPRRL